MKNISRTFFFVTITCFVLLVGVYKIALYETVDWDSISGIMLGVYLFFAYLFVCILYAESKNPMEYFRNGMPSREKQETYINKIYEHSQPNQHEFILNFQNGTIDKDISTFAMSFMILAAFLKVSTGGALELGFVFSLFAYFSPPSQ